MTPETGAENMPDNIPAADLTHVGCAGCGVCCEDIRILLTPAEYDELIARENAGGRSMSEESRENARWFRDHFTVTGFDGVGVRATCDAYDPESRLCTAHDRRPPICSLFPWYEFPDGDPGGSDLPDRCSYRWALPVGHPDRGPVDRRLLPLWPVDATEDAPEP